MGNFRCPKSRRSHGVSVSLVLVSVVDPATAEVIELGEIQDDGSRRGEFALSGHASHFTVSPTGDVSIDTVHDGRERHKLEKLEPSVRDVVCQSIANLLAQIEGEQRSSYTINGRTYTPGLIAPSCSRLKPNDVSQIGFDAFLDAQIADKLKRKYRISPIDKDESAKITLPTIEASFPSLQVVFSGKFENKVSPSMNNDLINFGSVADSYFSGPMNFAFTNGELAQDSLVTHFGSELSKLLPLSPVKVPTFSEIGMKFDVGVNCDTASIPSVYTPEDYVIPMHVQVKSIFKALDEYGKKMEQTDSVPFYIDMQGIQISGSLLNKGAGNVVILIKSENFTDHILRETNGKARKAFALASQIAEQPSDLVTDTSRFLRKKMMEGGVSALLLQDKVEAIQTEMRKHITQDSKLYETNLEELNDLLSLNMKLTTGHLNTSEPIIEAFEAVQCPPMGQVSDNVGKVLRTAAPEPRAVLCSEAKKPYDGSNQWKTKFDARTAKLNSEINSVIPQLNGKFKKPALSDDSLLKLLKENVARNELEQYRDMLKNRGETKTKLRDELLDVCASYGTVVPSSGNPEDEHPNSIKIDDLIFTPDPKLSDEQREVVIDKINSVKGLMNQLDDDEQPRWLRKFDVDFILDKVKRYGAEKFMNAMKDSDPTTKEGAENIFASLTQPTYPDLREKYARDIASQEDKAFEANDMETLEKHILDTMPEISHQHQLLKESALSKRLAKEMEAEFLKSAEEVGIAIDRSNQAQLRNLLDVFIAAKGSKDTYYFRDPQNNDFSIVAKIHDETCTSQAIIKIVKEIFFDVIAPETISAHFEKLDNELYRIDLLTVCHEFLQDYVKMKEQFQKIYDELTPAKKSLQSRLNRLQDRINSFENIVAAQGKRNTNRNVRQTHKVPLQMNISENLLCLDEVIDPTRTTVDHALLEPLDPRKTYTMAELMKQRNKVQALLTGTKLYNAFITEYPSKVFASAMHSGVILTAWIEQTGRRLGLLLEREVERLTPEDIRGPSGKDVKEGFSRVKHLKVKYAGLSLQLGLSLGTNDKVLLNLEKLTSSRPGSAELSKAATVGHYTSAFNAVVKKLKGSSLEPAILGQMIVSHLGGNIRETFHVTHECPTVEAIQKSERELFNVLVSRSVDKLSENEQIKKLGNDYMAAVANKDFVRAEEISKSLFRGEIETTLISPSGSAIKTGDERSIKSSLKTIDEDCVKLVGLLSNPQTRKAALNILLNDKTGQVDWSLSMRPLLNEQAEKFAEFMVKTFQSGFDLKSIISSKHYHAALATSVVETLMQYGGDIPDKNAVTLITTVLRASDGTPETYNGLYKDLCHKAFEAEFDKSSHDPEDVRLARDIVHYMFTGDVTVCTDDFQAKTGKNISSWNQLQLEFARCWETLGGWNKAVATLPDNSNDLDGFVAQFEQDSAAGVGSAGTRRLRGRGPQSTPTSRISPYDEKKDTLVDRLNCVFNSYKV